MKRNLPLVALFLLATFALTAQNNRLQLKGYLNATTSFYESQTGIGPGLQFDWAPYSRLLVSASMGTSQITATSSSSTSRYQGGQLTYRSATTVHIHERTTVSDLTISFDLLKSEKHALTIGAGMSMGIGTFNHPDTIVYMEGDHVYDGGKTTTALEWMPNIMFHYDWAVSDHWMVFAKFVWRHRLNDEDLFEVYNRPAISQGGQFITRKHQLSFIETISTIGLGVGYLF